LDAQWNPRRSTSGGLDEELLPTAWTAPDRRAMLAARGDELVVIGEVDNRQIPELPTPETFVLGSFLQPGNQALAASGTSATTLQGEVGNPSNTNMFGHASQVLLWGDRALVLGDDWDRTTATLFWLR
jgi:hypothetical protein